MKLAIVVLGDIGRSPRMQYHAVSARQHNCDVDLIGYSGSKLIPKLENDPAVRVHNVPEYPIFIENFCPRLFNFVLKFLWQFFTLFWMLIFVSFDAVLVQNPPGLPALGVCWLVAKLKRCKFVCDWHNTTSSILALSLHSDHILVKISANYEEYFGRKANAGFCVTKAMKKMLKAKKIHVEVLYDRPFMNFRPISLIEQHELFEKLGQIYPVLKGSEKNSTIFTRKLKDGIILNENRPAILVSSTSWTPDEDFGILLDALLKYDQKLGKNLPKIIAFITGKGPLKKFYEEKISKLEIKNIQFVLPWLEANDYPKLLASADLGICLHMSSSGLDLPMKIVDMFGCQLPVLAKNFNCITELVKPEKTGFLFENSDELFEQISKCFMDFPTNKKILDEMRRNLASPNFKMTNWAENWDANAWPLIENL